jgi:signal transduction histidine kinase
MRGYRRRRAIKTRKLHQKGVGKMGGGSRKRYRADRRTRDRRLTDIAAQEKPKAEFLSTLAYELRLPLAPLRNATEVLRLICTDPLQNHALSIADRQVSQLSRLADDLSQAATLTRRVITLETQSIDLSMLANQALENVRPLIDARKQHLYVVLPSNPVILECDPARLVQILEALLDNATRHTPSGGNISLSIASTDGLLKIAVNDDGPGIVPELLPFIFNFFARTALPGHPPVGGLGIGLAVIRNLVEIHRGSIHAERAVARDVAARLPSGYPCLRMPRQKPTLH